MKKHVSMTKAELIQCIRALEQGAPASEVAFEHERLLHELQVHQVELETQNRELREAQQIVELARDRYADLYDFAPVGYVTMDDTGLIRDVNLTAAGMLGVERTRLVGVPFHLHVAREDVGQFREHLKGLSEERVTTELRLARKGGATIPVVMQSVLHYDERKRGFLCRTAITDITERRQAEQALHESAALNHCILSSLSAHIAVVDKAGNIIAVNDAWTGFAQENGDTSFARTGVGTNYLGICRESFESSNDVAREALAGIEAVLARRLPSFTLEYPCHSPTVQRWFLMTVTPFSSTEGGAVISHVDISQRRLAEAALTEKEARLRAILDSAAEGIITIDERGIIESVNPAAVRVFGYPADEMIGRNVSLLMPSPDREQHNRYLANYHRTGERKIIGIGREVSGRRKDGSTFPLELSVSEVRVEDRRIFTGFVRDITERKRAEEELREQTRRYQSLVEVSPDAIFVLKRTRIEFINPEGVRLFGAKSAAEMLGRSPFDFFRQSRHEVIQQQIDRLERAGHASPLIDEELVLSDGSIRWVSLSSAMFTEHGETAVQFILRDITERRRLEAELLEISDREQQRIGHDLHDGLGQQLTALEMKCFLLLEDLAATDLAAGRGRLQEQARQMSHALRECVTVTRSLAHGMAPVAIKRDGLTGALEQLAHSTRVPGKFECRFVCRDAVTLEDSQTAKHLYRIAQEAVNNALKHARTQRIEISLAHANGVLRLQIKDHGKGLPKGLPKGGEPKPGMGLDVMRHRAHVIGASLEIESKPGKGACVTCTLPLRKS